MSASKTEDVRSIRTAPAIMNKYTKVIVQFNEITGECGLQFMNNNGETTDIVVLPHEEFWQLGHAIVVTADKSQAFKANVGY